MDMTGEYRIAAPRDRVWKALNDPEVLRQCIPGCDDLERTSDTELVARVTAKVGPVKAKFSGGVTLSDITPPESYTITGEGKGGAAGFAKGSAVVRLAEDRGETLLRYEAHAQVGGKLAQIGTRLVAGTAKKMADDFFGRFRELVAPDSAAEADSIETTMQPKSDIPGGEAGPVVDNDVADETIPSSPGVLSGATLSSDPTATATTIESDSTVPAEQKPPFGLRPVIWVPGLILLVAVLIWLFAR